MNQQPANTLPDAKVRNQIHNDLERNFLVEAAAGTGKTTSMVARMVNLVATGTCKIENLAAVTFTRKAAAELRERFQQSLRNESQQDRPDEEKIHLQNAIDKIESAFIGTYHSFCSLLLRERPVECRVDPQFREIDEREEIRLKNESWQIFLDDLYASDDPRLDEIEKLGLETGDLKSCFDQFLGYLDIDRWPHAEPDPFDLDRVRRDLDEYIDDVRQLVPSFPVERGSDVMMAHLEKILLARDNSDWIQDAELFRIAHLFNTSSLKPTQKCWHDNKVAKEQRDRFHSIRVNVVVPALDWWYQHRYRFVIDLMLSAREIYEKLRRATGGLDFQDLLTRVAEALRHQPLLREYYQKRFTHLLVDEFQDTDPIQAEVVAFLTSENHDEDIWQKCIPRNGSLFVVGDPKQSIYRFRRADIVTYQQVVELFEKSDGEVVTLSTNFRSVDSIRSWNNKVFARLFGNLNAPYSPDSVDMDLGYREGEKGILEGVFRLPLPDDLKQDDLVPHEADKIAKSIANAIRTGQAISRSAEQLEKGMQPEAEPGDFLIIARNKKHLQSYATALDRYNIPNEISGGNAFEGIEELKLLLQLLECIDDPRNSVSYVAILRGPLFGFGDADLYAFKRGGGIFSWQTPLPDGMPNEVGKRFSDANQKLGNYRKFLRTLPYPTALAKILDDVGLLARGASHKEGDLVAGGILKALEFLRERSWDFDSTNDLISELKNVIEESETDSCSVHAHSGSRVLIMNLHKAKGLEAPVVFLACTYGNRTPDPDCHVDRSGDESNGYLAIEKETGSGFRKKTTAVAVPSNWDEVRAEEIRFEEAESVRLLYVACTRAGSQLVISETGGKGSRYSFWNPLYSFLSDVPELVVSDKIEPKQSPPSTTELPSLQEAESGIQKNWSQISKPGYTILATKAEAIEKSHSRPTWATSGDYGMQWGSAVHALFELLADTPEADAQSAAQRITDEYDLGNDRLQELVGASRSLVKSELWKRVRKTDQVYTEIPFDSPNLEADIPTLHRGVIDLCFLEQDGWVIVDYKTDDITESDLDSAISHYRPQVEAYAHLWKEITAADVKETGIYFTKLNRYETL